MSTIPCKSCHATIPANVRTCLNCGAAQRPAPLPPLSAVGPAPIYAYERRPNWWGRLAFVVIALVVGLVLALVLGVRVGNNIQLCQSDGQTCYSDGQTIANSALQNAHLQLNAGWLGNFKANTGTFRLFDSTGNNVTFGNLQLDTGQSNIYFGMGDLLKNMPSGTSLTTGETYTVDVYYGTLLGGEGDKIGETTFAYGG